LWNIKKHEYTVTTGANGYVAFVAKLNKIPLAGVPTRSNTSISFFESNTYWYIRATGVNGEAIANTEITFVFYYMLPSDAVND